MTVTIDQLNEMAWEGERWANLFNELFQLYNVEHPAMFLAQCAHESNFGQSLKESLNYSASALPKVWPSRYDTELANRVGRTKDHPADQKAIAVISYGDRMGNRPNTDDGWKFIGRGLIQLTGRDNYTAFGKAYDMTPEEAVEYVSTDEGAVAAACYFWYKNDLNRYGNDIKACTRAINGGYNGLAHRKSLYHKYLGILYK